MQAAQPKERWESEITFDSRAYRTVLQAIPKFQVLEMDVGANVLNFPNICYLTSYGLFHESESENLG